MNTDLYEFQIKVFSAGEIPGTPSPGVAIIDGVGDTVTYREIPERVSNSHRWLEKERKYAAAIGELNQVLDRKPFACSKCGFRSWIESDFLATEDLSHFYCKTHAPKDGPKIYALDAANRLKRMKEALESLTKKIEKGFRPNKR